MIPPSFDYVAPKTLSEAVLLIKRLVKANQRLRAIVSQQAKRLAALEEMQ